MASTHWLVEGRIDPRWPINTRGNIGEVFPEVLTPLSYSLGVLAAETGWRDAYRQMGILQRGDFKNDDPVIIGLYAGYGYLNVSYLRMIGVRAPGSSPEAIDATLFGEGNPPPYVPRKGDKSLLSSLKILLTVIKALGTKSEPPVVKDSYRLVADWEAKCPPLDASDEALYEYMAAFPPVFRQVFRNHIFSSSIAAIVSGILADAAKAAGEPGLATHLIGAAGDVLSASYSQELYEIAKLVRANPALTAAFNAGTSGLYERLKPMPEAAEFNKQFAAFIARHGHRGPNDWELSSRTWENTPELALVAIDRMRLAEHDLAPAVRLKDMEARQRAAIEKVLPHVKFMDKGNVRKAVKALPYWSRAREATRDRAIRSGAALKRVFRELVRRAALKGGVEDPRMVAMLGFQDELPKYLKDPHSLVPVIRERWALRERFAAVTPPFFINSQDEVPGIEEMEAQDKTKPKLTAAGDVLKGDGGSAGVARGRARIVLDPADARGLNPGDILVAPMTDPAWTPLFLPASAVVVNVGALMSHAVIVSRELGIPCVVAVAGATERIADGAMLEVDGTAGTVTVLDASAAAEHVDIRSDAAQ
ncbi:MAG TPA: PEP-utilizing enzyme [Bradyrhizobium sp.]|nr:PEP-utilizing enzyme [Bradyrhizobium sp.]